MYHLINEEQVQQQLISTVLFLRPMGCSCTNIEELASYIRAKIVLSLIPICCVLPDINLAIYCMMCDDLSVCCIVMK